MNLTLEEAGNLAKRLRDELANINKVDVGVCPSFIFLRDVCKILQGSKIYVGAQNMYLEKSGAFTGEVSGVMLKDVGCTHVIIGHSERRMFFQETNSIINSKLKTAYSCDLNPILCVGEKQEERDADKTEEVVGIQLSEGLDGLTSEQVERLTIAYEPVWAIGTGKTATPEQANEVHAYIRGIIENRYGKDVAQSIRIQYGGSVKSSNAEELLGQPEIDGALVGGASLDSDSFLDIVSVAIKLS
ncbi:MAG: triosephosphate isomerase [Candidatus Scalindua rubra]|uniref:Triosephosphate isomerase n=1 Tax=Candidatus Scalindua rubra TaxID=1872076 RepID=A0A1E3XG80_9BACT|nr:MAG: triosephosphate isomerase [Candidatus Scalindua rubra]